MGFFTGIQLYGKASGILFSRKFWWFLLFPVIILLLLFIGGNILISLAGDSLYGLIEAKLTAWVGGIDRKSTRLNSSHRSQSRMPSSA